jgi:exodeoxyribonuclease VII small subunit
MAEMKFEEALERLEAIVHTLERGDLPLDDSLKAFEEGVKLSKSCLKLLDQAEKRVDVLLGEHGRKKPFATDDASAPIGSDDGP